MTLEQFEFIKYAIVVMLVFQVFGLLIVSAYIDDLKKHIDELKQGKK